jgi:hypothetical protein
VNNKSESANKPAENQQLSKVLMQMTEAEVVQIIGTIEALQADLSRLIPLFNGKEPVGAVEHTQDLLKILYDEISRVLAIKQVHDDQDHVKFLAEQVTRRNYVAVHHLLSKIRDDKRRLVWAGVDGVK